MDDFNSLIPFYQDDDPFLFPDHNIPQDLQTSINSSLLFTTTSSSYAYGETTDYQVVNTSTPAAAAPSTSGQKGKRQRIKPSNIQVTANENSVDDNEKRALHREIERQRRQEMAHLYASLRTLLPLEYIKGKRAITDHIHQAINYIKHKEKKIRELEVKRNKLRNSLVELETNVHEDVQKETKYFSPSSNIAFTVSSCSDGGIEILMESDLADDWFPLSKVLNVLLKEGLTVVSCIYTKVDQKLHCSIRTDDEGSRQMNDVDLYSLQQKLDAKVIDWKNSGAKS